MRREYEVHAVGPLRVTRALLSSMGDGSKIAYVSSRAGSIGDNTSGGLHGYRMAKAAQNMAGVCLARELAPKGIAVVMLHPGIVRTDIIVDAKGRLGALVQTAAAVSPAEAVVDMLARIDELRLETAGLFLHRKGNVLPW